MSALIQNKILLIILSLIYTNYGYTTQKQYKINKPHTAIITDEVNLTPGSQYKNKKVFGHSVGSLKENEKLAQAIEDQVIGQQSREAIAEIAKEQLANQKAAELRRLENLKIEAARQDKRTAEANLERARHERAMKLEKEEYEESLEELNKNKLEQKIQKHNKALSDQTAKLSEELEELKNTEKLEKKKLENIKKHFEKDINGGTDS